MAPRSLVLCLGVAVGLAVAQSSGQPNSTLPSSFPHNYPGIPNTNGNFSDSAAWQKYFHVQKALPNITFPLARSYAGNIPVNRENHPNNTLFFWGFEKTAGSLTSTKNDDEPWVIWLNGGPGSSSMLGLLLENGPIHFNHDFSAFANKYSWSSAADTIWIDQPVGTGWSTSDSDAFVVDEDEMGRDFFGFLSNLVQVFPNLAKRPLYLTGESYAGVYIPYISKTYFSLSKPPVSLRKVAIGDGSYADGNTFVTAPTVSVIETYPQLIGYDTDVLQYFKEQAHLCRYDVNLTYPQHGIIPTIINPPGSEPGFSGRKGTPSLLNRLIRHATTSSGTSAKRGLSRHNENARQAWKRDLSGRPNGTIDPWYGCDIYDEMIDYALNFTVPWKGNSGATGFDVYYIPDALDPEATPTPDSVGVFLNDPRVVAAIHAPTSKNWTSSFTPERGYPFGGGDQGDPSPPPMVFFSELASNFSAHGIHWALYSGNADSLVAHFGTEITIQNTSFGGIQGFTQRPATPWYDSEGNFAGTIHQERNLTYALFVGAGHLVPQSKPVAALTFFKEFVLGCNPLGTVLGHGKVVGGTDPRLAKPILPAVNDPIFFGSDATQGTHFFPSATIAAWNRFTATVHAGPTPAL